MSHRPLAYRSVWEPVLVSTLLGSLLALTNCAGSPPEPAALPASGPPQSAPVAAPVVDTMAPPPARHHVITLADIPTRLQKKVDELNAAFKESRKRPEDAATQDIRQQKDKGGLPNARASMKNAGDIGLHHPTPPQVPLSDFSGATTSKRSRIKLPEGLQEPFRFGDPHEGGIGINFPIREVLDEIVQQQSGPNSNTALILHPMTGLVDAAREALIKEKFTSTKQGFNNKNKYEAWVSGDKIVGSTSKPGQNANLSVKVELSVLLKRINIKMEWTVVPDEDADTADRKKEMSDLYVKLSESTLAYITYL